MRREVIRDEKIVEVLDGTPEELHRYWELTEFIPGRLRPMTDMENHLADFEHAIFTGLRKSWQGDRLKKVIGRPGSYGVGPEKIGAIEKERQWTDGKPEPQNKCATASALNDVKAQYDISQYCTVDPSEDDGEADHEEA